MDISYYKNFLTLIQTDNMTHAAEALHITQPALSKQLKYLESEFGAPLLIIKRGQKGPNFHLTPIGEIFYEKAKELCAIEQSLYDDIERLSTEVSGTLKIACSASRSTSLIQKYIQPFSAKYPAVKYEIYEGLMTDVEDALVKGYAEIGLCNESMVDSSRFQILFVQPETLYAVYRKDSFWPGKVKERVAITDLQKVPLSLCGGSIKMLLNSYEEKFNDLHVLSATTSKSSALDWAQSGYTVAIVPLEEDELLNRENMVQVPLQGVHCTFKKALITTHEHSLSLVAQQFINYYKSHLD